MIVHLSNGSSIDLSNRYSTIKHELTDQDYESIKNVIRSSASHERRTGHVQVDSSEEDGDDTSTTRNDSKDEQQQRILMIQMEFNGPVLTSRGMKKIARGLKKNKTIEELTICTNNYESGSWIKYLIEALMSNKTIKRLYLYDSLFPSDAIDYWTILLEEKSVLQLLDIMNMKQFTREQLKGFFGAVQHHTNLRTLHLRGMNNEALVFLGKALCGNSVLTDVLILDVDASITREGIVSFCDEFLILDNNSRDVGQDNVVQHIMCHLQTLTFQSASLSDDTGGKDLYRALRSHKGNVLSKLNTVNLSATMITRPIQSKINEILKEKVREAQKTTKDNNPDLTVTNEVIQSVNNQPSTSLEVVSKSAQATEEVLLTTPTATTISSTNNCSNLAMSTSQMVEDSRKLLRQNSMKQELLLCRHDITSVREETNTLMRTIISEKDVWKRELKVLTEKVSDLKTLVNNELNESRESIDEDIAGIMSQFRELKTKFESLDTEFRHQIEYLTEKVLTTESLSSSIGDIVDEQISQDRHDKLSNLEDQLTSLGKTMNRVRADIDQMITLKVNNQATDENTKLIEQIVNERITNLKTQSNEGMLLLTAKQDQLSDQVIQQQNDMKKRAYQENRNDNYPHRELADIMVKKDQLPFLIEAHMDKSYKLSNIVRTMKQEREKWETELEQWKRERVKDDHQTILSRYDRSIHDLTFQLQELNDNWVRSQNQIRMNSEISTMSPYQDKVHLWQERMNNELVLKLDKEEYQNSVQKIVDSVQEEIRGIRDDSRHSVSTAHFIEAMQELKESFTLKVSLVEEELLGILETKLDTEKFNRYVTENEKPDSPKSVLSTFSVGSGKKSILSTTKGTPSQQKQSLTMKNQMKTILLDNVQMKIHMNEVKKDIARMEERTNLHQFSQLLAEKLSADDVKQLLTTKISKIEALIKTELSQSMQSVREQFATQELLNSRMNQIEGNVSEKIQLAQLVEDLNQRLNNQREHNAQLESELHSIEKKQHNQWNHELNLLKQQNEQLQKDMEKIRTTVIANSREPSFFAKILSCFGVCSCLG